MEMGATGLSCGENPDEQIRTPRPRVEVSDCTDPASSSSTAMGYSLISELIDARIRSECLQAEGFPITLEDLQASSGISGAGLAEMIRERFGRPLPEGFMQATRGKIMSAFTDELRAIEGISELLRSLTMPLCVASNSHLDRVRHSLEVTGLRHVMAKPFR
jgi:beta-phosphoglucomutase-like phosphatase (HAD superfamily)